MLRVNLRDELDAIRDASGSDAYAFESEEFATALLAQLGVDTRQLQKQRQAKRQMILQESYTEDQVKQLCVKYRLRCLDVSLFKGKIDEEVPQKKRAFETDFTEAMNEEIDNADYRIVAPGEMFTLKGVQLDPLLMYRYQVDGEYFYKLIHQWGGDMNKWRMIANYPLRSVKHLVACSLLFWLPIVIALILKVGELNLVAAITQTVFLTTALTAFSVFLSRDVNGNFQTSDRMWNSDEE
jgi:hypothetical protein